MEAIVRPDVEIQNHGSLFLFYLNTTEAKAWVSENVSHERTYFGNALAVELRYARDLAAGMVNDGLTVR
jgi:hypothetical protein